MKKFSKQVQDALGHYVYILVDPRDNEIFYVGEGCGNRAFDHEQEARSTSRQDPRLVRIREIIKSGKEILIYIVRKGMDAATAYEVEAALIDILNNGVLTCNLIVKSCLTNKVRGHRAVNGILTLDELEMMYGKPIDLALKAYAGYKFLRININKGYTTRPSTYEACRWAWILNPKRANKADYVLAEYGGVVVGIYKVDEKGWQQVTYAKYDPKDVGRYYFDAEAGLDMDGGSSLKAISDPVVKDLLGRSILPARRKGNANPVLYAY